MGVISSKIIVTVTLQSDSINNRRMHGPVVVQVGGHNANDQWMTEIDLGVIRSNVKLMFDTHLLCFVVPGAMQIET